MSMHKVQMFYLQFISKYKLNVQSKVEAFTFSLQACSFDMYRLQKRFHSSIKLRVAEHDGNVSGSFTMRHQNWITITQNNSKLKFLELEPFQRQSMIVQNIQGIKTLFAKM